MKTSAWSDPGTTESPCKTTNTRRSCMPKRSASFATSWLEPMVAGTQERSSSWRRRSWRIPQWWPSSADHSEANVKMTNAGRDHAYIADPHFRKIYSRFAQVERHKQRFRKERREFYGVADLYWPHRGFTISEDECYCLGPGGKALARNVGVIVKVNARSNSADAKQIVGSAPCGSAEEPGTERSAEVYFFQGTVANQPETSRQKMRRKIDSIRGAIDNRRLGIVEVTLCASDQLWDLDRFSLRGKRKVNTQWPALLHCSQRRGHLATEKGSPEESRIRSHEEGKSQKEVIKSIGPAQERDSHQRETARNLQKKT